MIPRSELSFSLLTAFTAIARSLHFGQAAQQLGIAQPALSQQIRRIEDIVGARLLQRDTRNVRLTPAGLALHELAERLLPETVAGIDRVRRIGQGEYGRLTIGFTATMAIKTLPAAIELHRSRYPGVEIELRELLPDALCDMLETGQIDIGLARELIERPEFELIEIAREPYVAILPVEVAASETLRPLPLHRLRDQPFVLFPPDRVSSSNELFVQICAESGFTPRATLSVTSWQSAISLVNVGLGITLLPECTQCLALPNIAFAPIDSRIRSRIMLAHRAGEDRPIAQTFIRSAIDAMGSI